MLLLTGEPGSGKTTRLLDIVRARLRRLDPRFRLVVPTATMASHLRHQLAREGLAVRPSVIVTFARLLDEIVPGRAVASGAVLEALTARVLARRAPVAFQALMASDGLSVAVASAVDELTSAGCDATTWDALGRMNLWSGSVCAAFGDIYAELERELADEHRILRATLLAQATQQLQKEGWPAVEELLFDGFFTFGRRELLFLAAASRAVHVTIALPAWPGIKEAREFLLISGFKESRCAVARPLPRVEFAPAPNLHREAEEIARRIRHLHDAGSAWGDCGVILRARGPFLPLLEATFARFGIPCRSFFGDPLASHPVARLLAALIDAALSGWEHERALGVLRNPAARFSMLAGLECQVIEALPGAGLAPLLRLAPGLQRLAPTEEWRDQLFPATEWAGRLVAVLRGIVAPPAAPPMPPSWVHGFRLRAAALRMVEGALNEAASLLGEETLSLDAFWRHARPFLNASELRLADPRRDAVTLLDVYEARQWELPHIFLCGLLEGEFPRRPSPDPLLPDDLRQRLARQGVPVRTRADLDREEDFLLDLARSRATRTLVLSWPRFDDKGEETLRSFFLDRVTGVDSPARPVSLRAAHPVEPVPPPALSAPALLDQLRQRHRAIGATAVEDFLLCPFKFFAGRTLGLTSLPAMPADRLDPARLGTIFHTVLAEWHKLGGAIEPVFESVWNRELAAARIPDGHHAASERLRMRRALRAYAAAPRLDPAWRVFVERDLELELPEFILKGRIDRYDVNDQNHVRVVDFKYSGAVGLERLRRRDEAGLLVQLGLYLLALRRQGLEPAGAAYAALRGKGGWYPDQWGDDDAPARAERARVAAAAAAFRIFQGEIAPRPADDEACDYCAFLSACRIQSAAALLLPQRRGGTNP